MKVLTKIILVRCVRLRGALVGIDDEDDSTFTITVDNKTFHFQAKDSEEREKWIRALGKHTLHTFEFFKCFIFSSYSQR